MKLSVRIEQDLARELREEGRKGAVATTRAMAQVGAAVKANWRGQITGAGLGGRLANTIRSQVYPKGRSSLDAAALVYSRASKVVGAFDRGAFIQSKNGIWLAIPLPAAGRNTTGSKRITPAQWERKTGRQLRLIYRRGKPGLLVDEGKKAPGNVFVKRRRRGGLQLSEPVTFRNRIVPIFVLVPQVRLRKRLGLVPAAERIAASIGARIVAYWN